MYDSDLRVVKDCRKSLLFNKKEVWKEKFTTGCFDVTVGSYDLVGVYILSQLETTINKSQMGLYLEDGSVSLRGADGQKMDKTRKNIAEIFKKIGLQINIVTNLKGIDFLDVTFDLTNVRFRPYKKPNVKLLYVHTSFNHPPQIIMQLPNAIKERLCYNSSFETVFSFTKVECEVVLKKSGYKANLNQLRTGKETQYGLISLLIITLKRM